MTRLIDDWIIDTRDKVAYWERALKMKTGMGYMELASRACGVETKEFSKFVEKTKIAVIPVTTGQGIIGYFTDSVCSILSHTGFDAFTTSGTDVEGLHEACMQDVDIIFMADDDRFIAMNRRNGSVSDNSLATARGFVAAAEGFWNGLEEKDVLIAGYGNVGQEMMTTIKKKKANAFVYETDSNKHNRIKFEGGIIVGRDHIKRFKYILDATNTGGWLEKNMLNEDVTIVSPGVPISLKPSLFKDYEDRMIHDYLPIGVAVMAGMLYR